jgi:hypothetical protein
MHVLLLIVIARKSVVVALRLDIVVMVVKLTLLSDSFQLGYLHLYYSFLKINVTKRHFGLTLNHHMSLALDRTKIAFYHQQVRWNPMTQSQSTGPNVKHKNGFPKLIQ